MDSIVLYSSGIEGFARVESRPDFLVDIDDSRASDDDCFHGRPVLRYLTPCALHSYQFNFLLDVRFA